MKTSFKGVQQLNFISILKGVICAYSITLFLFLILGIVLYLTKVSESIIPSAVIIVSSFSILLGGVKTTKNTENLGWLHGGLIGFLYMGTLILLSRFLGPPISLGWNLIIDLVLGFVVGIIAGILGMNLQ